MSDTTEAWEKYLDGDADDGYHDRERPVFLAGFVAGQVAALEDAAAELDDDKLIAHWGGSAAIRLRARAAELKEQHDQPDA